MMMPKISIIVPIYNMDKYLHRCIGSILTQSFTDFELLLIDDGSTDNSGTICDEYAQKDSRVRAFHTENAGVSSAREVGLKNAKGEFISFVDADDYLISNALMTLLSACQDGDEIVIAGYEDNIDITCDTYVNGLLENKISWGLWNKLYKKHLLDEKLCTVPRYFNIGEDLIFQLMLATIVKGNIKCIKKNIYILCNNPDSATHTRKYSIEYEQRFIFEVSTLINNYSFDTSRSFFRLKINSLKMLVKNGVKISYDEKWVKELKREAICMPVTITDRMVLNVRNNRVCRVLLKLKSFLS